jgi:hypothetical protein
LNGQYEYSRRVGDIETGGVIEVTQINSKYVASVDVYYSSGGMPNICQFSGVLKSNGASYTLRTEEDPTFNLTIIFAGNNLSVTVNGEPKICGQNADLALNGNYKKTSTDYKISGETPVKASTIQMEIENSYKSMIGKPSEIAFENQNFKKLFESIVKQSQREEIGFAGWENVAISNEGDFLIGSGFVPRSQGWGFCGGGLFVLNMKKSELNIHICKQQEIISFGKNTTIENIKGTYPTKAKEWFCSTYIESYRKFLACK